MIVLELMILCSQFLRHHHLHTMPHWVLLQLYRFVTGVGATIFYSDVVCDATIRTVSKIQYWIKLEYTQV